MLRTVKPAYVAATVVALIWGVATPVIKLVVAEIPPVIGVFLRLSIAGFAFLPFLWTAEKRRPIKHSDAPKLLLLAFLGSTAALLFAFEGIARTTALDAAIIVATTPLLEAAASSLLLRERFNKANKIGFLVAFIGAIIVIAQPFGEPTANVGQKFFGNILVFLHVLAWVLFTIGSKEMFTRYEAAHLTGLTLGVGMVTTAPLAFIAHLRDPSWLGNLTWIGLVGLLYLSLLSSVVAYTLWEWALSKMPAGRLGVFLYLSPVIAILIAVPLLGERPTPLLALGALFTLAGLALVLRSQHKRLHHRQSHKL